MDSLLHVPQSIDPFASSDQVADSGKSTSSKRAKSALVKVALSKSEVLSVVSAALSIEDRRSQSVKSLPLDDEKSPIDLESLAIKLGGLNISRESLNKALAGVLAVRTVIDSYEEKKRSLRLPEDANFERVKAEEFIRSGVEFLKNQLPKALKKLIDSNQSDPFLATKDDQALVLYLPSVTPQHEGEKASYRNSYGFCELFRGATFTEKLIDSLKNPFKLISICRDTRWPELERFYSPAFEELKVLLKELKITPILHDNLYDYDTYNPAQSQHSLYSPANKYDEVKKSTTGCLYGVFFRFDG